MYPPVAFYFLVKIGGSGADSSFQEVSGIGSEIDLEEVVEGGENSFVHRLPKGVKHPKLSMKRGIAEKSSELVTWCRKILESEFDSKIETKLIEVSLLDENAKNLRKWTFADAYPVNWEIDPFNSTKNEVAIEKIDFSYNLLKREI
ncbi:MAG: phage tail protein [Desulfobacterales bacterium]|nr:phage tail protein [Desulfobacterales bacterium]